MGVTEERRYIWEDIISFRFDNVKNSAHQNFSNALYNVTLALKSVPVIQHKRKTTLDIFSKHCDSIEGKLLVQKSSLYVLQDISK